MYGVTKITSEEDVILISFSDADTKQMVEILNLLAEAGVVVDMISQAAPLGRSIRFSFSSSQAHFDTALKAMGGERGAASPMVSSGYTKINLFGEEMVESVGVAAKALTALLAEKVEVSMITTSDLDISLLVRREDSDVAIESLRNTFKI